MSLHELFDKVAEESEEFTDEITERAVELGGVALGTVQTRAKTSRLPAYPLDLVAGHDHVTAISQALAKVGATARGAIDAVGEAGDADTVDLFRDEITSCYSPSEVQHFARPLVRVPQSSSRWPRLSLQFRQASW
jgi:starvation-inducible DNA-binding protein